MPSKSLPSAPNLEQLKHQAKELLNALKEHNPEALARFREFHPKPTADAFSLSDAQLTIAREYGFESWPRLKQHIATLAPKKAIDDPAKIAALEETRVQRVIRFIEFACPDHHVRGGHAHL